MTTILRLVGWNVRTGFRNLVFVNLPLAFVTGSVLLSQRHEGMTGEDIALAGAVPLLIVTVGLRLLMMLVAAKAPTPPAGQAVPRWSEMPILFLVSLILATMMLMLTVGALLAIPVYFFLGMPWAIEPGAVLAGTAFALGLLISLLFVGIAVRAFAWAQAKSVYQRIQGAVRPALTALCFLATLR